MSEVNYKKKYEQVKRKLDRIKPYADTMARHNNRLRNQNNALEHTEKVLREKLENLCPHKSDWIIPDRETQWGEEIRHCCSMCYKYVLTEDINRKI